MDVSIRALESTPVQTYLSDSVQVADLLDAALDYTGPADITLTSFSISEEFLRRLFFIRKSGESGISELCSISRPQTRP